MKIFFALFGFCGAVFANFSDELYQNAIAKQKGINFADFQGFSSEIFTMPRNAKIIKNIEITYIDENGVLQSKIVEINKAISSKDNFLLTKSVPQKIAHIYDVSVSGMGRDSNSTSDLMPEIELPLKTINLDENLTILVWENALKIVTNYDANTSKIINKKAILKFNHETNATFDKISLNLPKFTNLSMKRAKSSVEFSVNLKDENATITRENNGYKISF